jgi:hypothetical protein
MMLVAGRGGDDGNFQLLGHGDRALAVASSNDWRKSIHVMLLWREPGLKKQCRIGKLGFVNGQKLFSRM